MTGVGVSCISYISTLCNIQKCSFISVVDPVAGASSGRFEALVRVAVFALICLSSAASF